MQSDIENCQIVLNVRLRAFVDESSFVFLKLKVLEVSHLVNDFLLKNYIFSFMTGKLNPTESVHDQDSKIT